MAPLQSPIFLDHHSTTPLDPEVYAAMQPWWSEGFGNPHSTDHWFGWSAHNAIESARQEIASFIGSEPSEVIFTSGATEANNLAILGIARGYRGSRDEILISAVEHKSVSEAALALTREGWKVKTIPVDRYGYVNIDTLESLIGPNTAIVSVMAVNNEIGTIQPIGQIGDICGSTGALLHCDAAQAPAAITLDVHKDQIDLLSFSCHKLYGPKGIGALFVRSDLIPNLQAISYGGRQEQGVRSGTLPTPLCVGFGAACRLMQNKRDVDFAHISSLSTRLWEGIVNAMPSAVLNGPNHDRRGERHPGNLNVCFQPHDASVLSGLLQPHLAISTGSACTTGIPEPSHVLQAIGLTLSEAESSIRFGVGRFTSENEIDRAITLLTDVIHTSERSGA